MTGEKFKQIQDNASNRQKRMERCLIVSKRCLEEDDIDAAKEYYAKYQEEKVFYNHWINLLEKEIENGI